MDTKTRITQDTLLTWLEESQSHVLEYSPLRRRAYIHDEDGDDIPMHVPVALVRQLIASREVALWREIGEWNDGYDSYRPTAWVAAFCEDDDDIDEVAHILHAVAINQVDSDDWYW